MASPPQCIAIQPSRRFEPSCEYQLTGLFTLSTDFIAYVNVESKSRSEALLLPGAEFNKYQDDVCDWKFSFCVLGAWSLAKFRTAAFQNIIPVSQIIVIHLFKREVI
jgi:hypothetical protein